MALGRMEDMPGYGQWGAVSAGHEGDDLERTWLDESGLIVEAGGALPCRSGVRAELARTTCAGQAEELRSAGDEFFQRPESMR